MHKSNRPKFGFKDLVQLSWFSPAIIWTVGARISSILKWVAVAPLIATCITLEEQGYYYTFISLMALQGVFEAGLGPVAIQMIAHAVAVNKEGTNSLPKASYNEVERHIAAILQAVARLFSLLAIGSAIIIFAAGSVFFINNSKGIPSVNWMAPWLVACIGIFASVIYVGISAIEEGFGHVCNVSKYRCLSSLISAIVLVMAITLGFSLYSIGISLIFSSFFPGLLLITKSRKRLLHYIRIPPMAGFSWLKEAGGYHLKMAVSWISGWVIFQIIPPFMFARFGADDAGRFGLAMQLVNGIQAIASTWVYTKQAHWATLAAQKQFNLLFNEYRIATWTTSGIAVLGCISAMGLLSTDIILIDIRNRLPSLNVLAILLLSSVTYQVTYTQASVLRALKDEPFAYLSVSSAVVIAGALSQLKIHNIIDVALLHTGVSVLIGLGGGTIVFTAYRRSLIGIKNTSQSLE